MKTLVTGGGGFLGSAIVRQLITEGHEVTAAGRGEYPAVAALGARTVRMDVADREVVRSAVAGQDTVFHAAAKAGYWGRRADYVGTNVVGTQNVLAACREHGVRRLVYTSSPSVVFDGRDHEGAGADLPYPPGYEALYPETKAAAERFVLAANGPDLATVSLRPHLIWGSGDPHLLPRLITRAAAGKLRIVGDGRNRVGITYVDNAAAAHVRAAEHLEPGAPCAGRAYFVTDDEPVEMWTWLNDLLGRLDIPAVQRRIPLRAARALGALAEAAWVGFGLSGEPPMTRFVASQLATSHWYDLEPARRDLGYAPVVGPAEAMERTVAWWRNRGSSAPA